MKVGSAVGDHESGIGFKFSGVDSESAVDSDLAADFAWIVDSACANGFGDTFSASGLSFAFGAALALGWAFAREGKDAAGDEPA